MKGTNCRSWADSSHIGAAGSRDKACGRRFHLHLRNGTA